MKFRIWLLVFVCMLAQGACSTPVKMALGALAPSLPDYYGKVIDQYGQPIPDADIAGTLIVYEPWSGGGDGTSGGAGPLISRYTTKSDAGGMFQFTGLRGLSFNAKPMKEGYEMGGSGYPPEKIKTSQDSRDIFIMYKLQGAEPMAHVIFDTRVPYDGTPATFDLLAGKKGGIGDFKITLTRMPLQIKRGTDHFEWKVKFEVPGGGLVESIDVYPYLAPEKGYQSAFEFSQVKDAPGWTPKLFKTFYIHFKNDRYARVTINLSSDAVRPDTGLSIETFLNPLGSRNLEFDPKKTIKPTP